MGRKRTQCMLKNCNNSLGDSRPDKKFCSTKCRNAHSSALRSKDKLKTLKKDLYNNLAKRDETTLSREDKRIKNLLVRVL
jgi:hypothetical protein